MSKKLNNIIIFFAFLAFAAAIYIWYYPLNNGELSILSEQNDYQISAGEMTTLCEKDPCLVTLKTGFHSIIISKEGYFTETKNIQIKRGKGNSISIPLKKIPSLTVSALIPQTRENTPLKKIPDDLQGQSIKASVWNKEENKLAFIDNKDECLKIWGIEKDLKTITVLKNVEEDFSLYWAPDETMLVGNKGQEIYFIDIKQASRRKKILPSSIQNILWSPQSDYLLANEREGSLIKINKMDENVDSLGIKVDLKKAVWGKGDDLFFYEYDPEKDSTGVQWYSPVTKENEIILTQNNFKAEQIGADANLTIYLYDSNTETWYKLDY